MLQIILLDDINYANLKSRKLGETEKVKCTVVSWDGKKVVSGSLYGYLYFDLYICTYSNIDPLSAQQILNGCSASTQ